MRHGALRGRTEPVPLQYLPTRESSQLWAGPTFSKHGQPEAWYKPSNVVPPRWPRVPPGGNPHRRGACTRLVLRIGARLRELSASSSSPSAGSRAFLGPVPAHVWVDFRLDPGLPPQGLGSCSVMPIAVAAPLPPSGPSAWLRGRVPLLCSLHALGPAVPPSAALWPWRTVGPLSRFFFRQVHSGSAPCRGRGWGGGGTLCGASIGDRGPRHVKEYRPCACPYSCLRAEACLRPQPRR